MDWTVRHGGCDRLPIRLSFPHGAIIVMIFPFVLGECLVMIGTVIFSLFRVHAVFVPFNGPVRPSVVSGVTAPAAPRRPYIVPVTRKIRQRKGSHSKDTHHQRSDDHEFQQYHLIDLFLHLGGGYLCGIPNGIRRPKRGPVRTAGKPLAPGTGAGIEPDNLIEII